ncbi:MAG: pyruvate dehydrogenase complex dihydrolipoamide acetyltransferase [Saprospiraceae bacterium]|nr:pyruvate dehydrogenase complex dihydrolipoamide acetyltransferase [Saprospiraceae bacterium]
MADVIRMPRMSDTMEEGNIVAWLKSEGDTIESGETIAEVETDKATMELDSYSEGVLLHIAVKDGAVPINGIIAVIGQKGEDWKAAIAEADGPEAETASEPAATETPAAPETPAPAAVSPASSNGTSDQRIKASPLAKSIAREAGIDLAAVSGTGDHGRIVKKDVEAILDNKPAAPAPAAPASTPEQAPDVVPFSIQGGGDQFEEVAVSQMRKTIARRLSESKFGAPHFYLTIEIDMQEAISWRKKINQLAPVKISFNDLVIKAAGASLRQHPAVNSSWLGDRIRYNKNVNIGVAVAVEDGLLVPVIRYADIKSLSQINTEVKEMAGRARDRKLSPEEMQGNTFTISNLGMFGIEEFTAIINPPDACILAIGSIIEKPIVRDGRVVPGNMMKVTLSCDHRVVDGATGAKFLQTLKEILEEPLRLLV